jgi:DNA polymerase-1
MLIDSDGRYGDLLHRLRTTTEAIGFDTESHGPVQVGAKMLRMTDAELTGASFAFQDGICYYLPLGHEHGWKAQRRPLSNPQGPVWAHNWKHEHWASGWRPKHMQDSMLLMWLLQKGDAKGRYGLKGLVKEHFQVDLPSFKDVTKGRTWDKVDPEEGYEYACADAYYALKLGLTFGTVDWVKDPFAFEMRILPLYYAMERKGMRLSLDGLTTLRVDLEARVQALQSQWAGMCPYSMSSPKQIQELYKLGTWPSKNIAKTKTGLSTDKEAVKTVLLSLPENSLGHRLAKIRQECQELSKNLNTYTHSLLEKAVQYKDCRLRPSILQHGTATGRISMASPNLMQIPVRSELGRRVKSCFIPADGYSFVAADFSQIELRVMAHFAGPGALRDAYINNEDIHQKTANLVGCDRNQAKTINFAYVYGAGPKKLAKTIGVSEDEALEFIQLYEKAYPEVPLLRKQVLQAARARAASEGLGYVRTLMGHRRYLPDIANSGNMYARFGSERQAFNAVIQGSAADVMKLAMLRVAERIDTRTDIVCQVHDELTLEVQDDCVPHAVNVLKVAMEGAYPLAVPLVAEVRVGKTWNDCK